MARIVLTTFGTAGDINPFIALGIGLRARGHEVIFALEEGVRAQIEVADFSLFPLSGDIMAVLGDQMRALMGSANPLKALRLVVDRYLVPTLRTRIEELIGACAGADLLVASNPQLAAAFVADLLSLPLITLALTPAAIPSAWVAPHPLPFRLPELLQRMVNRATWTVGQQVTARIVDPPLNQMRTAYGLRPRTNWLAAEGTSSHVRLVAVAVSPALCPSPPDWAAIVHETGFLFWDRPPTWQMPEELSAFLAAGEPVVAISCGSMSLDLAQAFDVLFRESIAATRAVGARALVLGARREALPDPLPSDIGALSFAPFSEVYPRCTAVIHHGGIGSAGQALRAGVPQLVVPWALDQFWTAAQIERIGAGRALVSHRYTAALAAPLLGELIASARVRQRCAALAVQIAAEDGVATLCDAIQGILAAVGQPVGRDNP
jgi:rhamnosyltransferase subunit B